jgi:hypothetical protein
LLYFAASGRFALPVRQLAHRGRAGVAEPVDVVELAPSSASARAAAGLVSLSLSDRPPAELVSLSRSARGRRGGAVERIALAAVELVSLSPAAAAVSSSASARPPSS